MNDLNIQKVIAEKKTKNIYTFISVAIQPLSHFVYMCASICLNREEGAAGHDEDLRRERWPFTGEIYRRQIVADPVCF